MAPKTYKTAMITTRPSASRVYTLTFSSVDTPWHVTSNPIRATWDKFRKDDTITHCFEAARLLHWYDPEHESWHTRE